MILGDFIVAKAPWGEYLVYERDEKFPHKLMFEADTEQEAIDYINGENHPRLLRRML